MKYLTTLRLTLADLVHNLRLRRITRDPIFHELRWRWSEAKALPGEVPEDLIAALESLTEILAARHGVRPGTVLFLVITGRPPLPWRDLVRALAGSGLREPTMPRA